MQLRRLRLREASELTSAPLGELRLPDGVLIAAVLRGADLVIPSGAELLRPDDQVYIIGRSEDLDAFERLVTQFERIHAISPEVVVVDGHPGYATSTWARTHHPDRIVEVQHHHAHVAAVMAEQIDLLMRQLGERQRRVLEMRLQGYLLEVIADDIGCSERTVRRWMDQIKSHLQHDLNTTQSTSD